MELNTSQKQFIADIKERVRHAQYEALKTSNDLPSAYKALLPSAELISQKLSDFLKNE